MNQITPSSSTPTTHITPSTNQAKDREFSIGSKEFLFHQLPLLALSRRILDSFCFLESFRMVFRRLSGEWLRIGGGSSLISHQSHSPNLFPSPQERFHKDNLRHLSRFPDFFVTKRILTTGERGVVG